MPPKDMDTCRPKDHNRWSRPPFWGLLEGIWGLSPSLPSSNRPPHWAHRGGAASGAGGLVQVELNLVVAQ
jgi:hypothetical protein